jgi:uncharacterized membrane protein YhaH (DUF805 family)
VIAATAALLLATFASIELDAIFWQIQRLHDLDMSGWWLLVPISLSLAAITGSGALGVTLWGAEGLSLAVLGLLLALGVGVVWEYGMMTRAGTPGPNRFGPAPLPTPRPSGLSVSRPAASF